MVPPLSQMGSGASKPLRGGLVWPLLTLSGLMVGEAHAHVQGETLKAWALSSESFELPGFDRGTGMLKFFFRVVEAVAVVLLFVGFAPFLAAGAIGRLYRRLELHSVYGGDEAARDRAEYKQPF